MEKCLIIYSAVSMMLLTLFLYIRNYLDNKKAAKAKELNFKYFKAYQGEIPKYLAVSRQTLKNQFELSPYDYISVRPDPNFEFHKIITIEDHLLSGGFGSWMRESIIDKENNIILGHAYIDDDIIGKVGTEEYLLKFMTINE